MKVTIVQGAFLPVPPIRGGAVEKLWCALGLAFAKRGVEVTHISREDLSQLSEETDQGVRRLRIKGYDWSNFKLLSRLYDFLYSFRVLSVLPVADILVTNTFFLPLLANKKKNGYVYVSVHRFPRKQFQFYKKAVRFQCVSNIVRQELVARNPGCKDRATVIPNFVETVVDEELALKKIRNRSKKILFVGRIHPEKGIQLLIESFALLPVELRDQWEIEVVGPSDVSAGGGGPSFIEGLQRLSKSEGVNVRWTPAVFDSDRLAAIYAAASIFVYPSNAEYGEAFPLAPLEAMAQGTPAIVSNLKCFKDYIKDGENGWVFDVFSENPAESLAKTIASAIYAVEISGPAFLLASIQTARSFSIDEIADRFLRDFRKILANE
jgi:glycosyltransferase involved in cell wall biosynthesis